MVLKDCHSTRNALAGTPDPLGTLAIRRTTQTLRFWRNSSFDDGFTRFFPHNLSETMAALFPEVPVDARLTAECIALVSGLSYTGSSMTEIAERQGITRAAVSKRCVELTELLDTHFREAEDSADEDGKFSIERLVALVQGSLTY
jgi:hypothetical protein